MTTILEIAERKRECIKMMVEDLEKKLLLVKTTPKPLGKIEQYITTATKGLEKLEENYDKIVLNVDIKDMGPHTTIFLDLNDRLADLQYEFNVIKTALIGPVPVPTPPQPTDIKLPRLDLPKFNGNLHEWMAYRDKFKAAVHDNVSLTKAQKLIHLKSTLTGEAARLVQSMSLTDASYDIAWDQLTNRYENKRELLFSILHRFFNQPQVQSHSAASLRSLIDVTNETTRSLEALGRSVTSWDDILLFSIFQKLDTAAKELWEQSLKDSSIPPLKDLLEFLESRARALQAGGFSIKEQKDGGQRPRRVNQVHHATTASSSCVVCSEGHPLYKCSKFLAMPEKERFEVVRRNRLCTNCLQSGHYNNKCTSNYTCRKCNKQHHTLLHQGSQESSSTQVVNHHSVDEAVAFQSLLASAEVTVWGQGQQQQQHRFRALCDGGSHPHFVTESCVQRCNLPRRKFNAEIRGIGCSAAGKTKGIATITISPHFNNDEKITFDALIIPKITGLQPSSRCDPTVWPHLSGLQLADPNFHEPAPIDILLGADVFYRILMDGKKSIGDNAPVGIRSALGWLVAGKLNLVSNRFDVHHADVDLDDKLAKFWDIESSPDTRIMTKEERECEAHFADTHQRDQMGRFIVQLPIKSPRPTLGPSRDIAIQIFLSLERRLKKLPERYEEYKQFMKEYVSLGHMELVPLDEINRPGSSANYFSHQFVLKETSTTTKFRVVFNASMTTASGVSLNNTLMVGPTIQDTLVSIISRFRLHPVAFTADLAKMYRQIRVTKESADLQRIVWRDNHTDDIKDFRLLTVTYGTAPAPYLATKCLQQLAIDEMKSYPLAAHAIKDDMYVDDLMSGAPDDQAALEVQSQLLELTKKGGFNLRKWCSNSPTVINALPPEFRETSTMLELNDEQTVKALGIYWNTTRDLIQFKININIINDITQPTKRSLLSQIAKIFDPLGWLAPVIVRPKILIQSLWKLELGWDDVALPQSITTEWYEYKNNLHLLEQINIPRCVKPTGYTCTELVGFCDASIKAYSAVTYLRVSGPGMDPVVTIISAKTRVAPTKTISLPRLELCSAVLLADLMKKEKLALKIDFDNIMLYSDSTVTLDWINSHPSRWTIFVANRVTEVQSSFPVNHWGHVRGEDNPADCASRGIDPSELVNHPLWWHGPPWLADGSQLPVYKRPTDQPFTTLEQKKETVTSFHVCPDSVLKILQQFSTVTKVIRATAWLRRYYLFHRTSVTQRSTLLGPLSTEELNSSLRMWVKVIQQDTFPDEISCLQTNRPLSSKSKILSLHPFLDSMGILRVGGRLRNAPLPPDQKNPVLLPRHHRFTQLLITDEHLKHLHAGPQMLLSVINRKFWIISARDAIRHQIKKCIIFTRHAATMQQQFMGDLPSSRVTPARAFLRCGVDFAGPFQVRAIPKKSKVTLKAYLALFVCFTTKAVHLEVVSSLSTDAFLAAFRRSISRRGRPSDVYSDCGTNFVGAAKEIKESMKIINSPNFNNEMTNAMSKDGITWHFHPPGAPHFGGLWEAGVKSVKFHLYRVVGLSRLTFEELTTVMTQIEACLNSRPLTPMSSDPNDLMALTPGHFLIGGPLTALPEPDLTSLKTGRLSRWQHLQQMTQSFWQRWTHEFIARMQQRPKWLKSSNQVQLNSLVLIKDERFPPLKWKLGRVTHLHPGPDGILRVVTLRTADDDLKRPNCVYCL